MNSDYSLDHLLPRIRRFIDEEVIPIERHLISRPWPPTPGTRRPSPRWFRGL